MYYYLKEDHSDFLELVQGKAKKINDRLYYVESSLPKLKYCPSVIEHIPSYIPLEFNKFASPASFELQDFDFIAGPCSVESLEQILIIANSLKASGVKYLRGGAYKPRTSPFSFQGLELDGLKILEEVKRQTGLKIVTEIPSLDVIDQFDFVDIIQVGARNMQNFALLKALGKLDKPILLKRGLCATVEEWLNAALYIYNGGNKKIILCERGIRSYSPEFRNLLDLSSVALLKRVTNLPVIVDPSHGLGDSTYVPKLSLAALVSGADAIMCEVHNDPKNALSDGDQSLNLDEFRELVNKYQILKELIKKETL